MTLTRALICLILLTWAGPGFAQSFSTINTGTFPGDPSADTMRSAFGKVNANFGLVQTAGCPGVGCATNGQYHNASGNVPGTSVVPEDDSGGINQACNAALLSANQSGTCILPPATRGRYYVCQTKILLPAASPSAISLLMQNSEIDILPGCTPSSDVIAGMVQTASQPNVSGYPQSDYVKSEISGGTIDGGAKAQPLAINHGRTLIANMKLRNAPGGSGNIYAELVINNGGDISFGPGNIFGAYNDPGNTLYNVATDVPAYGIRNIGGHDSQLINFTIIGAQIAGVDDENGSGMQWGYAHPFGNAAASAPNDIFTPLYAFQFADTTQFADVYADTPQTAYVHVTHTTGSAVQVFHLRGKGFSTQIGKGWPAQGVLLDVGAQVDIQGFDFKSLPNATPCITQTGGTYSTYTTISNNFNCSVIVGGNPTATGDLLVNGTAFMGGAISGQGDYIVAPTTGSTVTVPTGTTSVLINGSSQLASLTFKIPGAPAGASSGVLNQHLSVCYAVGVTTLTYQDSVAGTGDLANPPIAAGAGTCTNIRYDTAATMWRFFAGGL